MKLISALIILILGCYKPVRTIIPGDEIVGTWYTAGREGIIKIYRANDRYYGKLIWSKHMYSDKLTGVTKHQKNGKPLFNGRLLRNLVILSDLRYASGEWNDGKIYDPLTGKTYSCSVKLKYGSLYMSGFSGLGQSEQYTTWKRTSHELVENK